MDYIQAQRARTLAMAQMHDLFTKFDVIVAPSGGTQLTATNLCGQPAVIVPNGIRGDDAPPPPSTEDGALDERRRSRNSSVDHISRAAVRGREGLRAGERLPAKRRIHGTSAEARVWLYFRACRCVLTHLPPCVCPLPLLRSGQSVMSAHTLVEAIRQHSSSGTSIEPASTPVPMWMGTHDGWQLMLHGNAFVANTQQQAESPRNRDAFFSTNWIMPMAQHALGSRGQITFRAMFSLEPATISNRNYPELFQQGETAFGAPIVDGQHPHDFFMEARRSLRSEALAEHAAVFLRGARG